MWKVTWVEDDGPNGGYIVQSKEGFESEDDAFDWATP